MAGMSLLWRDIRLYPSFHRDDEEPDILKIHLEQFLVPAVPADPSAYISQSPPSGGSSVSAAEAKKPIRVKVTGRKYMAAGANTSAATVSVSVPAGVVAFTSAAAELVSPTRALKKRRVVPPLTAFQAIQAAHALPTVEGVTSMPLTSVDVVPPATSGPILSELISQASSAVASSSMSPLVLTTVVAVTASLVSTPLSSSVSPTFLFDSPIGIFSASEKEMPTTSTAHEATSAKDTADKRYQPKWKIAESSRLIFPPVVHHWVEQAYHPAESAYVEGLNNENLMNATMVDTVSQSRRLAAIRRRWMHDNNELHQVRAAIQELKDEKYHLESELQATGLRESRFVSEKNKAEDDLKRVTAHLAEKRILWARDIAEKDRVLAHAKTVQEELERKAVAEAQKVRSELSAKMEKFTVDTHFVSQVQERYQGLTMELKASNAKFQAKQAELEELEEQLRKLQQYLCQSESFVTLLGRLSAAAYQSGHHDGIYHAPYFDCQWSDKITPAFHANRGKLHGDMADALEAACDDQLPSYANLTDKVTEDGVDSLRLMLDPTEESEEERVFCLFCYVHCSMDIL
ncbi:hypothetical protein Hanom_Chr01g00027361 [Helianthus anomalus]